MLHAADEVDTHDHQDLTLDQLDYICDHIAELREMAGRSGLASLAAILALAQVEAAREGAARRR
jgi:DNA-binding ferritin-like protein